MADNARAILTSRGWNVTVSARGVGLETAQRHFDACVKTILVEDIVRLDATACFSEKGRHWRSVATTLRGDQIRDLFVRFGDNLFSANVRGFLELGRKTSINHRMMETAHSHAENFWVFNNGITLLTRRLRQRKGRLTLTGISVINGAQTTGVVGRAQENDAIRLRIPCRIVECTDEAIVRDIITFNNAQNAIRSSDLRSRDSIQMRLAAEFDQYGVSYIHRRGGGGRLPTSAILLDSVAAYLCAFHGDFQTANRGRRKIFEDEHIYGRVFRRGVSAEHVYLVLALADAIGAVRGKLAAKEKTGKLPKQDSKCFEILRHSPSKYFLLRVIGGLDEQVLDARVSDRYSWKALPPFVKPDREALVRRWVPVVETIVTLVAGQIPDDLYDSVRSDKVASELPSKIAPLLSGYRAYSASSLDPIRQASECA